MFAIPEKCTLFSNICNFLLKLYFLQIFCVPHEICNYSQILSFSREISICLQIFFHSLRNLHLTKCLQYLRNLLYSRFLLKLYFLQIFCVPQEIWFCSQIPYFSREMCICMQKKIQSLRDLHLFTKHLRSLINLYFPLIFCFPQEISICSQIFSSPGNLYLLANCVPQNIVSVRKYFPFSDMCICSHIYNMFQCFCDRTQHFSGT